MEKLRTDPAHRAAMGARGREIAERRWSMRAHLDRYLRLISAIRSSDNPYMEPVAEASSL
jgi:hypothetical protein